MNKNNQYWYARESLGNLIDEICKDKKIDSKIIELFKIVIDYYFTGWEWNHEDKFYEVLSGKRTLEDVFKDWST